MSEEHCHIPGLCLLQLLQHIPLLKKDYIRYKKVFSTLKVKSLIIFIKLQIHSTPRKYKNKLFQFQGDKR